MDRGGLPAPLVKELAGVRKKHAADLYTSGSRTAGSSIFGGPRQWAFRDGAYRLRVVVATPRWEDDVSLTVTEIRLDGAASIQRIGGPLQLETPAAPATDDGSLVGGGQ